MTDCSQLERDILEWNVPEEVLAVLLKDRSTDRNLIWATDDYAVRGKGFGANGSAIRQLSTGELTESDMAAFFSIGFTHHMEIIFKCRSQAERGLILCHSMDRPVVELAVRRYSMPLGVATYRTSEDVPPAYKALKPLLDGSQKLLVEMNSEVSVSPRKSKVKKGGGK